MSKALILLGFVGVVHGAVDVIYPASSFVRTLHENAIFTDMYCMENGKPATNQGVGNQQGTPVSACNVGLLRAQVWAGNETGLSFDLGGAAALVDLGTPAEIAARYNLDFRRSRMMWTSLHFNRANDTFFIMNSSVPRTPLTYQSLHPLELSPLRTTSVNSIYPVRPGRVYLVRLSPKSGYLPSLVQDTTLFAKLQVLQMPLGKEPFQPIVVQWDVVWGDTKFVTAESSPEHAKAVRDWALALSIVSLVGLVTMAVCLCTKAKGTTIGYQAM